MRLLLKLAALSAGKRKLLLCALGALWRFRLALWVLPFPRIQKFLEKTIPRAPHTAVSVSPVQIGRAIVSASRFVPCSSCLVQAVAAQWMLRRENWASDLHVGVVKTPNGGLLAHAWVECEGAVVVGGGGLERYTPILRSNG